MVELRDIENHNNFKFKIINGKLNFRFKKSVIKTLNKPQKSKLIHKVRKFKLLKNQNYLTKKLMKINYQIKKLKFKFLILKIKRKIITKRTIIILSKIMIINKQRNLKQLNKMIIIINQVIIII